jgi:hypothetical protein
MNRLEHSIKNVLNYMKLRIEERKLRQIKNNVYQREVGRLSSIPKLKIMLTKRKRIKHKSFIMRNSISDFPIINSNDIKRANSFNFQEESIQKILKRMVFKINKTYTMELKYKRSHIIDEYSIDEDNNLKYLKGFSFSPDNFFIFIFDIIIIIAIIYSFIFTPLIIAKNEDIRKKDTIFQEVIKYLVDIIYIMDFVITIFRGYYDHEMTIMRSNKRSDFPITLVRRAIFFLLSYISSVQLRDFSCTGIYKESYFSIKPAMAAPKVMSLSRLTIS